MNWAV